MHSRKSHLTAIARTIQPAPVRWLVQHDLIRLPVLDYGCGKCHKVNPPPWVNYDPYYWNIDLNHFRGSFMTVVCSYVLCVLKEPERIKVLKDIQSLLMKVPKGAAAYIIVRNDKPKQGWGISKRGTYQGRVRKLMLPIIYQNSQFRIYRLTRADKI